MFTEAMQSISTKPVFVFLSEEAAQVIPWDNDSFLQPVSSSQGNRDAHMCTFMSKDGPRQSLQPSTAS